MPVRYKFLHPSSDRGSELGVTRYIRDVDTQPSSPSRITAPNGPFAVWRCRQTVKVFGTVQNSNRNKIFHATGEKYVEIARDRMNHPVKSVVQRHPPNILIRIATAVDTGPVITTRANPKKCLKTSSRIIISLNSGQNNGKPSNRDASTSRTPVRHTDYRRQCTLPAKCGMHIQCGEVTDITW